MQIIIYDKSQFNLNLIKTFDVNRYPHGGLNDMPTVLPMFLLTSVSPLVHCHLVELDDEIRKETGGNEGLNSAEW